MRILQICNKAPYPANDGSSIAIYNMSKGFIENNIELHLLTINTKKHFKADINIPEDFKTKSNYTSVYRNTNVNFFGAFLNLFSGQSYFVSRFFFKKFQRILIEKLKQYQFDIIQLEGLFMCTFIPAIRANCTVKIVLRAHNIEHYIWNRHIAHDKSFLEKTYLKIQNKRLKEFELKSLGIVDAVIPISKNDELEMKKWNISKKIFTSISGVDINFYSKKIPVQIRSKSVFYFASMDWIPNQKAVEWFIENCWEDVRKEVPDAKLIIAGRGMPLRFFKINKPNVLIVETVENAKTFYLQHQVMIVPLLSGSGLRIKIIEGMAYGKAIVSTSIGAEGINYTHEKNIFIADEAKDFSNRVITLLKNDELRNSFEINAEILAQKEFDNHKIVSGLIDFYKTLIA